MAVASVASVCETYGLTPSVTARDQHGSSCASGDLLGRRCIVIARKSLCLRPASSARQTTVMASGLPTAGMTGPS